MVEEPLGLESARNLAIIMLVEVVGVRCPMEARYESAFVRHDLDERLTGGGGASPPGGGGGGLPALPYP